MASILVHGLRAGADGFVHLTTDQTIAIYCVHIRRHMYLRYAAIALFRVDAAIICVEPCDENALFVADCYIHTGDIPKAKVKFVMTTQIARGQS